MEYERKLKEKDRMLKVYEQELSQTRLKLEEERKQKEQSQILIEEEFIRQKKQLNEVRDLLDKLS